MPIQSSYDNAGILQSEMHQNFNSVEFTGISGYKYFITGLLNSGNPADIANLTNSIGREYYRKLNSLNITGSIAESNIYFDTLDVGFRPLTLTGLYYSIPET